MAIVDVEEVARHLTLPGMRESLTLLSVANIPEIGLAMAYIVRNHTIRE